MRCLYAFVVNGSSLRLTVTYMYVYCTKLSFPQTAGIFDNRLVVDQLRASGIVETIKIRQTGYPIRHLFIDFVKRWDDFWDAPRLRASSPLLVSDSLRASSPILASEARRARTRERAAKPRGAEELALSRASTFHDIPQMETLLAGQVSDGSRKSPFAQVSFRVLLSGDFSRLPQMGRLLAG